MQQVIDVEKLLKIGKEWSAHGKKRIYFNDLEKFYGLKVYSYKSGAPRLSYLNGNKISNNEAFKILIRLQNEKFYFDLDTQKFVCSSLSESEKEKIINGILNFSSEEIEE